MKIYTKTGDDGRTGLYGGSRVSKDDLRIRTYGTLDELNALMGVLLAESSLPSSSRLQLRRIQAELFQLGAELATPRGKTVSVQLIDQPQVQALEKEMDQMEADLRPLQNFILPGGSRDASLAHFIRTVCRRAERECVSLHRAEPVRPVILQYLNRLSDFFFVCARWINHQHQVKEEQWVNRSSPK